MAEPALIILIENLNELIEFHSNFISDGAKIEIQGLKKDLLLMKEFLQESEDSKQGNKNFFGVINKMIEEVVHEAENSIYDCVDQIVAKKEKNIMKRRFNFKRMTIAKQVKKIREKINPMLKRAKEDLQIGGGSVRWVEDKKVPLVREEKIVGFEEEAKTLVKDLTNKESDKLDVISITGMGGLGKTTLAWKLYRDSRIQNEFSTVIWVYASQEFNKKDVYLKILEKFTQEDMSGKTDKELGQIVRKHLEKIKFLLFVDDVWTVEAWNTIQAVLTKGNKMGKIVVTTRNEEVAWHANHEREPYRLRFFNQNESWDLLQLEVFHKLGECPLELQNVGKCIADQCFGLPSAIVVIGRILVGKFSLMRAMKYEWERVSNCVSTYLNEEKHIENIMSPSYNNLSCDLRDCFLYLGVFPKDFEIPAWKLKYSWIAEGFIEKKPGMSLEEIAEENLNDLITQNLVMVDRLNPSGEVRKCRVHDMVREFCITEGAIERRNLFQEIRKSKGVFEPAVLEIDKYSCICSHSHLTSFLWFSKEPKPLSAKKNLSIPTSCELHRVLEVRFSKSPTKLNRFQRVRYLTLSCDNLKVLPEAIAKLYNIQTLTINTMSRTLKVKADVFNMTKLRHVITKASMVLNKKVGKGDAGENLRTLMWLSTESCTKDVFDRFPNIKTLGIRGDLSTLLETQFCQNLVRLTKLKLSYDVYPRTKIYKPLPRLPEPGTFPPNLKILTLSATFLDWTHMITLGNINTLEVLKLKDHAFIGDSWQAIGGGFHCLEYLHIVGNDLEFWKATGDSFPILSCLVLKNCAKLQEVPIEIGESLQLLELERVTRTVVASAKKIEEVKHKTQRQRRACRGGFKLVIGPGEQ